MSTPLQGQGAHPTSSHLLPVTPLGKLGMVLAAEILQNPHFIFFPLDSRPDVTPPCTAPAPLCPPHPSPGSGSPQGHQPPWEELGRDSEASPTSPAWGDTEAIYQFRFRNLQCQNVLNQ